MVKEMNGLNNKGEAKCGITMDVSFWSMQSDDIKDYKQFTLFKPEVQIQRRGEHIQIDLIFLTSLDKDLQTYWKTIEEYGQLLEDLPEDAIEIPYFSLTIVPDEWDWAFYAVAMAPIFWSLLPKTPGGDTVIIRMLFKAENIGFYENENMNMEEVEAEAERKVMLFEQELLEAQIKKEKENSMQ